MKQNDEFGFYLKRYKINKKELPNKRVEAERKKINADTFFPSNSARFTVHYEFTLKSSSTQTGA